MLDEITEASAARHMNYGQLARELRALVENR